ncbi:type VI secretion system-associated protein TagF [Nitrosomonas sp.]|uniref:type VI secretion system-associated protein TagF n=1 Tax=Nitrosomonas sp. TaxID=42353 RepID=UPI00284DB59C|nr:type VI secretion system-associated protein TagF [Nitrosomonas sp.]MDR4515597.1 type VI secretion system-associated protein TagF [Nitrosomonas sp.]
MDNTLVPGWYGKIPAMGDFTSRRLPPEFIQFWDTWLQNSIIASRAQLGENWLNLYLNCPIWRFVLMPKLYDQSIWTGILMPSVDKVGRYFPLTIAIQLEALPGVLTTIINAQNWFKNIEQLALRSLNAGFSPDNLDQNLLEHPFPAIKNNTSPNSIRDILLWWESSSNSQQRENDKIQQLTIEDMPSFFSFIMEYQLIQSGTQKSIWWHESLASKATHLQCFNGLPETDQFIILLKNDD